MSVPATARSSARAGSAERAAPTARSVSLDLLGSVLHRRQTLDEALASHPSLHDGELDARDGGLVRMLVTTCLRRLGQIDAILAALMDRPLPEPERLTTNILRLGVAQILFMRIPEHAAVNDTVALCDRHKRQKYKGLVNAVLRRVARDASGGTIPSPPVSANAPDWLYARWTETYGPDTAGAIAEAHLTEPPLDLSVKDDPQGWAHRLGGQVLPSGTVRLFDHRGPVTGLPGYADGGWWIQDAAAALPVKLLGPVVGRRVLDLCAAPGGKTMELAAAGAIVTAVDRSEARLARIAENLSRTGLSADLVAADGTTYRPDFQPDAILIDAPCSATGTIRRHPEIPWIKQPRDIATLAALQARLLDAAISYAAPGTPILYCTCSLEPEEGRDQIARLTRLGAPVHIRPIAPDRFPGFAAAVTGDGLFRSLPCHLSAQGGMDGFFAALLVKE